MTKLPLRQIHLDFHTSPLITDVGVDFDPDAFVRTLKAAAVNSITVFARCHHGLCYYPTEVATPHPALKRDLLGEMIEACHCEGIQAPIYITVGWDELAGTVHPEWRQVDRDGTFVGRSPFSGAWGWQTLCMNSPYADYVADQTEEVCRRYPVDGVFFDIVRQNRPGCTCTYCQESMRQLGLNPSLEGDLQQHSLRVERVFMRRLSELVHTFHPEARVFFNSRLRLDPDPEMGMRSEADDFSHWEIESLPSGQWGYSHFPLFARYFQTLGKELLGMTARFHLSWADFGGLKNLAALEYECFRHLAFGAGNSIGDQLHPRGRLNPVAYDRIGTVYRQVEACEPWCVDAMAQCDIGVLMPGRLVDQEQGNIQDILEGCVRMLTEMGHQFQILDSAADLNPYRLLIAPDQVAFDEHLTQRISAYLGQGGALLLSDRSGLRPDGTAFALGEIGLDYRGAAPFSTFTTHTPDPNMDRDAIQRDFLWQPHHAYFHIPPKTSDGINVGILPMDYIMYELGSRVQPHPGTTTLVEEVLGYFDRAWDHFCSHRQTPPDKPSGYPMVTQRGRVIYFASPIFRAYHIYGMHVYKALVRNAIGMLLPEPLVRTDLPSAGEVTLLAQARDPQGQRLVCHLLYYTPQRRTKHIDIIEEAVPLYNISVAIRTPFPARRVYLAPQDKDLAFEREGDYVQCVVPELRGHQLVVVE